MVENTRIALRCPKVWRLILALAIGGILVRNIESTISSNSVEIGENTSESYIILIRGTQGQ